MNSIAKAITSLALLALVSAAPAYSENATYVGCPNGYARVGEICISAESGDVILPVTKTAEASEQASRGQ